MKQKLTNLKGEIDESTILLGDFKTALSVTDKTSRKSERIKKI